MRPETSPAGETGGGEYTSELTRQIATDAETVLAPPGEAAEGDETRILEELAGHYDGLSPELRKELVDLALLLPEREAQGLRAVICKPGASS